jgi:predicted metal-dependent peptidase
MLEEGVDHSEWEQFEDLSEGEQKLMDKQVQTLIKEAQEQTIKKRGVVPGEIDEIIKLSVVEKPKFNWRKFIRRFTGNSLKTFTKKQRRKENHRYSDNPGLRIKMRQKMLVAIDTSASVNNDELTEFMNEIYHLYRSGVAIEIVQCDTKINSIKEYKGKFELEISGRGGTSFDPVLDYYMDNPKFTSLVYFTDGEAYTELKPNKNILWVLSERSDMNNELPGKVIKLEI